MNRRSLISLSLASIAAAPLASIPFAQAQGSQARCAGDGTPAQFLPRNAPDPQPQENDLAKFPKCPYCGMDRRQYHHSRMLIQYANDVPDAVCSIHCAAISLSLNIDAEPKAIWVGDNAANGEPKPLVDVDRASFVIGGSTMGVMTLRSKVAYGSEAAAKVGAGDPGGRRRRLQRGAARRLHRHVARRCPHPAEPRTASAADERDAEVLGWDALTHAVPWVAGRPAAGGATDMDRRRAGTALLALVAGSASARQRERVRASPPAASILPQPGPRDLCPVCGMLVAKYPAWVADRPLPRRPRALLRRRQGSLQVSCSTCPATRPDIGARTWPASG